MDSHEQVTGCRRGENAVAVVKVSPAHVIVELLPFDGIQRRGAEGGCWRGQRPQSHLAAAALQLISVIAIWFWRKWGLHLIGLVVAVGLVLDLAGGIPDLIAAAKIVLAGALAFMVIPHWEQMIN